MQGSSQAFLYVFFACELHTSFQALGLSLRGLFFIAQKGSQHALEGRKQGDTRTKTAQAIKI